MPLLSASLARLWRTATSPMLYRGRPLAACSARTPHAGVASSSSPPSCPPEYPFARTFFTYFARKAHRRGHFQQRSALLYLGTGKRVIKKGRPRGAAVPWLQPTARSMARRSALPRSPAATFPAHKFRPRQPHLIALHGGDRNEETPSTDNGRGMLMRRACALALSPRSFLLLEHSLQPTPSPLCGLASWLLLGACSLYPGE